MIWLLILISVIDVKSHRIHNWSIAVILVIQALSQFPIFNKGLIPVVILVGLILYRYCGVGPGDIKLIATLLLCSINIQQIPNFVWGLAFGGLISSAIFLFRYRNLSIHIPLAPAITVGFIATNFR